jgi:hypothetical protein
MQNHPRKKVMEQWEAQSTDTPHAASSKMRLKGVRQDSTREGVIGVSC